MSENWPQLPLSVSEYRFEVIRGGSGDLDFGLRDPQQVYSPVGPRVSDQAIRQLIDALTENAEASGFPEKSSSVRRIEFDRTAAFTLYKHMNINWAEAANPQLWSFLSLVALPHITNWRFGTGNKERWIASDLTRHTWSRLWWQANIFQESPDLLRALQESDLNALLERRDTIGSDPRLTCELARAVVAVDNSEINRRLIIRDAALKLRRWLAFLDVRALDDQGLSDLCSQSVAETVAYLKAHPEASK